jgi:serine/threonine protein kinase
MAQTAPLPHDILDGRYTIERLLGSDDCGDVLLAFDTGTRQRVAIHHLPAGHPTYDRWLARFQRAVQVSELVRHPNLVANLSCTIAQDRDAYLAMEFVDGPTLRNSLAATGAFPVDRALAIARDTAAVLQALHARDIVHRDLSPAHLLLARDGAVKVTGPGEAQIGRDSPILQLGAPRPGTPGYRSPELDSGFGSVDGRSDLYSLGAILYEMLTGAPYEPMLRPLSIARPNLAPQLVALVTKLLERQPAFRYERAADVARDLDAIITPPTAMPGAIAKIAIPESPPASTIAPPASAAVPSPPPIAPSPLRTPTAPPVVSASPMIPQPPVKSATTPPRPPVSARPGPPLTGQVVPPAFSPPPRYPGLPPPARRGADRSSIRGIGKGYMWIVAFIFIALLILRSHNGSQTNPIPTATPRPRATVTATPLAATRTAIAAQPMPWNDPKGRISLTLPPGWRVLSTGTKPEDVATLFGPDGLFMLIRTSTPKNTIDAEFASVRLSQSLAANRTFTQGPVTPVTIGGEAGKYQAFSAVYSTPTTSSSSVIAPYAGVEWLVEHGGVRYDFLVADIKSRRTDCDAIVASVIFTK